MSQIAPDHDISRLAGEGGAGHAPFHLWVVGLLSLAWNAFGVFDYTMTNLRDADYLAAFPAEMMSVINAMPLWAHLGWAFGVWGSLVGSLLLLVRSRWAYGAFALSVLGLAASTIWQQTIGLPPAMKSPEMVTVSVVIWVIVVTLLLYSKAMVRRGIIR